MIYTMNPHIPFGACGKPKNWATWWVLDGGDDADSLRAADVRGDLNSQVVEATAHFLSWDNFFFKKDIYVKIHSHMFYNSIFAPCPKVCVAPTQFCSIEPFITGDGKAMLASNFLEGQHREWFLNQDVFFNHNHICFFPSHEIVLLLMLDLQWTSF